MGKIGDVSYSPVILLGDNVSIGDESQITSINRIVIGSGVLTGKKVLITDNAHGQFNETDLSKNHWKEKCSQKAPLL